MPASLPATQVFRRDGRATSIEFSKCVLRVTLGPDAGKEVLLEMSSLRIGTSPGCGLVVRDATVSRIHCEIEVQEKGFLLRDLGSTNGTFVGDLRVREVFIQPGTVFSIGKNTIDFAGLNERAEIRLSDENRFGHVLGQSMRMREIFYLLEKVADKDVTILLVGETGTGKEVFARSIHEKSNRHKAEFVTLDCGSIPETLIESELFGHVKGAFTGATTDRAGIFESAEDGTVFLDEIGDLPLAQQTKLLRVLESKEIKRVGSARSRKVDVRIIAATNRVLAEEVQEGNFRKDLFYRLSVMQVEVPPLRERPEDIQMLSELFMEELGATEDQREVTLDALKVLKAHTWPGNVRELRNVLERASVLSDKAIDAATVLAGAVREHAVHGRAAGDGAQIDGNVPYADAREQFEKHYLLDLLRIHDRNVSRAAQSAGIHRQSLHRLMKKHGIRLADL